MRAIELTTKLLRAARVAAAGAIVLVLAACGGGADEPASMPQRAALRAPQVPDAVTLMDWAEGRYRDYFPGPQQNRSFDVYLYRFYPDTGNYVGVAGQDVYIFGPVSGNAPAPVRVGALADFACQVFPASCAAAVSSLRGQTLYGTALGSRGNACRDCHGTPPGSIIAAILNAAGTPDSQGEPAIIRAKINSYFPMQQFAGVSDADLADIAAYVNAVRWGKPLQ